MRFVSSLRSVSNRPAVVSAGRNVFRLAALSVLGASFVQLPIYAQGIAASNEAAARPSQSTIDIEFDDAPVADILTSIADMSKVNILVSPDVDVRLKNVKLHDYTVEEAIQLVCKAANLSWTKEKNAYIISKAAPLSLGNSGGGIGAPSITSSIASTPFAAPGLSSDNLAPMTGDLASLGIPDIARSNSSNQEKTTRMITLHNIKPSLMAFWLDPAHHPEPTEMRQAHERQENVNEINNPHSMQEDEAARADERRARLGQMYGTPPGAPNGYTPYANPYANPYGALTPYTQFSNQFGGGGNNGGGNRNGGNNSGGNRSGGNNSGGNSNGGGNSSGNVQSADGAIQLPVGIDNIIAIDAQNAILIQGSGDGIETIQNIIDFLDKPLQQVEIEAQFVELTEGASDALGLDFTRNNVTTQGFFADTGQTVLQGAGTVVFGYVGKNFTATFNALKSKSLLKVVNSPRITTFNNMTAQLTSVQTVRIITLQTNVTNNTGGNTQTQTQVITPITTGVTLTVTPTINRDGTITMAVQPFVSTQNFVPGRLFPDISNQQISTMSNVKDGDTLAIGGLRVKSAGESDRRIPFLSSIPIIGKLLFTSKSKTYTERELIIFVTPRIVRRIEDPVIGT